MNNLYNNAHYEVYVDAAPVNVDSNVFDQCYAVRNLKTAVVEFRTPSLPEALHVAVQWDVGLTKEQHLWPYKKQERAEKGHQEMLAPADVDLLQ